MPRLVETDRWPCRRGGARCLPADAAHHRRCHRKESRGLARANRVGTAGRSRAGRSDRNRRIRRRATKRPEEPAVRRLARRRSRLLVIVGLPPGPLPTALRSSVRFPGTAPGIAPRLGSAVSVGPFGQDLEWTFDPDPARGLVHELAVRLTELSTKSVGDSRDCGGTPPTDQVVAGSAALDTAASDFSNQ